MRYNTEQVHRFHTSILEVFYARNKVQFLIKDKTKKLIFLYNRDSTAIQSQVWVTMENMLLAEVHTNGFRSGKLKTVFICPFLDVIEAQL
jgi:hypothetical protein